MDRRTARACAMKLIYENEMGGDGGLDTLQGMLEVSPDEREADYMNMLFEGVKANKSKLDDAIQQFLEESWKLDRIAKVDYAILLIGAYEMLYTELSDSIAINEAVELANIYSADKSGAFINGVLGSMARSKSNAD